MATRNRVMTYNFKDGDGTDLGAKANEHAKSLEINFVEAVGTDAEGKTVYKTVDSAVFNMSDLPEAIIAACAANGLKQKLGDSAAGAKTVDERVENIKAVWENLVAGDWTAASQSGGAGPRPSMVKQALINVLVRDYGKDPEDQEFLDKVATKVSSTEGRKATLANPAVKAEFERLKAEAAAERAAKAAEAAEGADGSDGLDDLI